MVLFGVCPKPGFYYIKKKMGLHGIMENFYLVHTKFHFLKVYKIVEIVKNNFVKLQTCVLMKRGI